jgi:HK97 family phage major capsid protein
MHRPSKQLIGYRKNGAPIYLAQGGAPRTRRRPEDIETEISRHTAVVFEVEDMESPTEEDLSRSDAALAAIPTLESELTEAQARQTEIQRLRQRAEDTEATEPGDQSETEVTRARRERGAGPAVIVKGDEFEILRSNTRSMSEKDYRQRLADDVQRGLERYEMPDDYNDSVAKFVKRHKKDTSWSKNILGRLRPDYVSGFEKVTTGTEPAFLEDVERAAMAVGTNTAGGYLVPTHLDPTLILTNAGVSNVIRGMSRVVTLTGGANKWNGVTTAGATASWDAELTEVSDDTPAIGPAQVPVFSAKALVMASIEAFEDITGLAGDVQMILADAKDRLEAVAHATGSGSGQPTGIFTALDANTNVELQLATGATWTLADIQNLYRQLGVRWRGRGTFLMHPIFRGSIQALGTALSASYSTDITQPYTDRLLGRPVQESDEAPSVQQTTTVDNLAVFGDFSNFVIVDKPGSTSIEFIPHLFNTSNNLPDGRRGWYMHFRNGSDSVNDLAFRLLQDKTTA